jgi:hypothetical protein
LPKTYLYLVYEKERTVFSKDYYLRVMGISSKTGRCHSNEQNYLLRFFVKTIAIFGGSHLDGVIKTHS